MEDEIQDGPEWAQPKPGVRKVVSSTFDERLARALGEGCKIISDGPSGVQLEYPKKMKMADKICLIFGIATLIIWGIGLLFILVAVLDYCLFTKAETMFLRRS